MQISNMKKHLSAITFSLFIGLGSTKLLSLERQVIASNLSNNGDSTLIYQKNNQYFIEWIKSNGSKKTVELSSKPTNTYFSKQKNIGIIGYLKGLGSNKSFTEVRNEEGVIKSFSGGINSAGFAKNTNHFFVVAMENNQAKYTFFADNKVAFESSLEDISPGYLRNKRKAISFNGDVIFDQPANPEGSSAPKVITFSLVDDPTHKSTIEMSSPIYDALFINANHYFIAVDGRILAFKNELLEWSAQSANANIRLNAIQADAKGKWILGVDERNGFFNVFDNNGNTVLSWNPYNQPVEALKFLEQAYPPNRVEPLKSVHSGKDPQFKTTLLDNNKLLISFTEQNADFIIDLNNISHKAKAVKYKDKALAKNYMINKQLSKVGKVFNIE